MTICLKVRVKASQVEKVSEQLWELCPTLLGIQEAPDTGKELFETGPEFEILEFGSAAAIKAAEWIERDAYRGKGNLQLHLFIEKALSETDFIRINQKLGIELEVLSQNEMPNEDYLEEYKKRVRGSKVGENLWVGPPWDKPAQKSLLPFFVEPGLAFGTGDHPTTQLCLEKIESYAKHKLFFESVLDLGCGTGVLGLAARLMLKPTKLVLADLDTLCRDEVKKTFELNQQVVDDARTLEFYGSLGQADALAQRGFSFDLIVSNIYAEILAMIAPKIFKLLKPSGKWLCSGILEGKSERALDLATQGIFKNSDRKSQTKRIPQLDAKSGLTEVDEIWVMREFERS